ncbi:phosphotransferase [Gordonia asplenii]
MTTPKLIDVIADIDVPWIQDVLSHNGFDSTVHAIALTPVGAGNVSDTVRVDITYTGDVGDAPASVVVKLRPSAQAVHEHGLRSGAYHREIGGYTDITARRACRIPYAYLVAGDETNINLVMEDLTESAEAGNQVAGATIDQAQAVVVELARLHSEFFPMTSESAPTWMIRLPDVCEYWSQAAGRGALAALARFADDLDAESLDAIREATELVRVWHLLPQERLTFTHGDPRVDNVLFETVGGAVRAVIIDWQVTGLRNPMYDVGYFMSGSIDTQRRRANEMRLIRTYVEEFSRKAPGYDLETAVSDYQIQLLSGLYITLAAIDVLPDNDVVNALILALLQRNCAAVLDWKSVAALRNMTFASAAGASGVRQ